MTKRWLDFGLALIGLTLVMPMLLIISLLILITMGPPILFKQTRVGELGREFNLMKFRTMNNFPDSPQRQFEPGNARRVTALGRLLRRAKLDEFPQLLNVLKGEMSLVGPRPEVKEWVSIYPERWAFVHSVRPGITDPASLVYRDEEKLLSSAPDAEKLYRDIILPHKLSLYEAYIKNQSLSLDIKLICKTLIMSLIRTE